MKLIELENEMPVYSAEARTIKEFNAILRRDRGSEGDSQGRKKTKALAELSFVHFYCTFDNRFNLYETEEERNEAIKVAVGLSESWEPDDIIKLAIQRYTDMMKTESMDLVDQTRRAIKKLKDFIEKYDPTERTKSDGLVFGPDKMQKLIEGMPSMIKSLNDSKKIVQQELEDLYGKASKKQRSMAELGWNDKIEGEV